MSMLSNDNATQFETVQTHQKPLEPLKNSLGNPKDP